MNLAAEQVYAVAIQMKGMGYHMVKQDFFQDIAMTKHPIGENDREIEPRSYPERFFEMTKNEFPYHKAVFSQDICYQDRLDTFQCDLAALKEYYRPFLSNLLPTQEQTAKVFSIKNFEFRYVKQHEIFSDRNSPKAIWEQVTIPDYRGPAHENGKWRAYYRTQLQLQLPKQDEKVVLRFQCVDYKAVIYLDGCYIGSHEGFFAPFEFDITDFVKEQNELIVECLNDYTILGTGPVLDGDKIYAATGPGWDDPNVGWHHCPAGAGVFGKVSVEYRPAVYLEDIFVRPDIDKEYCELRIGITNYEDKVAEDYLMEISLLPKNYQGSKIGSLKKVVQFIGIGKNEYRCFVPIKDYRLWEMDSPYLYGAVITLKKAEKVITNRIGTFGLKKFVSDETSEPKGKFYFNNKPIILRGANEMGHLQQCVMQDNYELLIEDILIAKLCNLNYYRITQRPVQEEIYDYFDMLGMLQQCDFPLFSFLRRNQFSEAVKQVTEMEHLVRSHVSTVMVTFINEPMRIRKTEDPNDKFSKRYEAKGHRHLLRDELEAFFVAARKAIYVENPDRVIKNVEGDYDSPTAEGMPDFHTYTMWYTNHGEPIGRLMKGYLPPVKTGWMVGCGEYGAEGLDNLNIIMERYPKDWLTPDEKGNWYPDKIISAQTYTLQGDWYQEQKTIKDWVAESQKHQAVATALMTDTFRRRADIMNQTAIHLLIDAWPSGWMKTLVGCDRIPKPAYFAYMDSLVPLRVNLYCDRRYVYSKEKVDVEAWLLNDLPENKEVTILVSMKNEDKVVAEYRLNAVVGAVTAVRAGLVPLTIPDVTEETRILVDACITGKSGDVLNAERLELIAYPDSTEAEICGPIFVKGDLARELSNRYDLETSVNTEVTETALISDLSAQTMEWMEDYLKSGKKAILFLQDCETQELRIGDLTISTKPCTEVFFAASKPELQRYHFNMLYNHECGYIDIIGKRSVVSSGEGENLVYTYAKVGRSENGEGKPELPFVRKTDYGKGTLYTISLQLQGRVKYNPNLDAFLISLLKS